MSRSVKVADPRVPLGRPHCAARTSLYRNGQSKATKIVLAAIFQVSDFPRVYTEQPGFMVSWQSRLGTARGSLEENRGLVGPSCNINRLLKRFLVFGRTRNNSCCHTGAYRAGVDLGADRLDDKRFQKSRPGANKMFADDVKS